MSIWNIVPWDTTRECDGRRYTAAAQSSAVQLRKNRYPEAVRSTAIARRAPVVQARCYI
jgi:hypothetical protein